MEKREVSARIRTVDPWYHVLELAPGIETPGMYDMRPTLPHYPFPASLAGRTVLDVGASNGFFAFHFEKLGARKVVATNLRSYRQHDYPKWYLEKRLAEFAPGELERLDQQQSTGGFEVAHACLGSRVEHLLTTIYELPKATSERFDFAFCGSVLVHLRDPVLGLEAIREVLVSGAELVVATSVDLTQPEHSYALFNGKPEQVSWWVMSPKALVRMCEMAGFTEVTWCGSFVAASRHGFTDAIGVVRMRRP